MSASECPPPPNFPVAARPSPFYHAGALCGMDGETIRRLEAVALARAELLGKPREKWTDDDNARFGREVDSMPGEFRVFAYQRRFMRNKNNQALAKSNGLDMRTGLRMVYTGGEKTMRYLGHPASPLRNPNPGLEGHAYGVDILDAVITPS